MKIENNEGKKLGLRGFICLDLDHEMVVGLDLL
jgi:hypothetical protein